MNLEKATQPQLVTVEEASARLGISRERLYALIRHRVLPPGTSVHLGRTVRLSREALDRFIESGGQRLPGGWRQSER